jgi:hypothetical protein
LFSLFHCMFFQCICLSNFDFPKVLLQHMFSHSLH